MSLTLALVEHGIVPDAVTRIGIRRLLAQRLIDEASSEGTTRRACLIAGLSTAPLAIEQAAANAQHYEVPSRLYELCLGKRLMYSSGWWGEGVRDLD